MKCSNDSISRKRGGLIQSVRLVSRRGFRTLPVGQGGGRSAHISKIPPYDRDSYPRNHNLRFSVINHGTIWPCRVPLSARALAALCIRLPISDLFQRLASRRRVRGMEHTHTTLSHPLTLMPAWKRILEILIRGAGGFLGQGIATFSRS